MSKNSRNKQRKERKQREEKRATKLGIILPVVQTAPSAVSITAESTWELDLNDIRPDDPFILKVLKVPMIFFNLLRIIFDDILQFHLSRFIASVLLLGPVIHSFIQWAEKSFSPGFNKILLYIPYEVAPYFDGLYTWIEQFNIGGSPAPLLNMLTFVLSTGILTALGTLQELDKDITPKKLLNVLGIYVILFMNSQHIFDGEIGKKFVLCFAVAHVSLIPSFIDMKAYRERKKAKAKKREIGKR